MTKLEIIEKIQNEQNISFFRADRMFYNLTVSPMNRVQTAETTPVNITGSKAAEILTSLPETHDRIKTVWQGDNLGYIVADAGSIDDHIFVVVPMQENIIPDRTCRHCGNVYSPVAESQKYCNSGCRFQAENNI